MPIIWIYEEVFGPFWEQSFKAICSKQIMLKKELHCKGGGIDLSSTELY